MRSVVVVENDLLINSPEELVEEHPQSSRTRNHEYNNTYNFNGITIKTNISFFLYQDNTKKSKTTEEQQSKEGLSSSYGQSATRNFRTGSRPPLSPFNGIKDFDDSWLIFIDEEEEGVKYKDLDGINTVRILLFTSKKYFPVVRKCANTKHSITVFTINNALTQMLHD